MSRKILKAARWSQPKKVTEDREILDTLSVLGPLPEAIASKGVFTHEAYRYVTRKGEYPDRFPYKGHRQYWQVQLESAGLKTAENPAVFVANAIAQALSHGCALDFEAAAELPSLRSLEAAWNAQGVAYNDSLDSDEGWRGCIEGWGFDREKNEVSWTTNGLRLSVRVQSDRVDLWFSAGPAKEGGEGRTVAHLILWARSGSLRGGGDFISVEKVDSSLIEGREDRLDLLWRIDDQLGGEITQALQYFGESEEPRVWHEECKTLLDAKAALEPSRVAV